MVCYCGRFGNKEVNRGDAEEKRDSVALVEVQEPLEVKLRHPVYRAAHVEWVDEISLNSSDVGGWQVGEGPVFEWAAALRYIFSSEFAGNDGRRYYIRVG